MKKIFRVLVFLAVGAVAVLGLINLQARWELETRRAAIDAAIQERIARATADNARRNKIAEQLQREALKSEQAAQARWEAAKVTGRLPVDNTVEGFDTRQSGSAGFGGGGPRR
jgi:hypothetical protein